MRSFSYTKFEDDLSIKLNKIPLQQDPNTLRQHYELAVGSALDVQAPIKSRTMKCRLRHPWYNDSIHLAREIRRANENKWRSTKLEVHRQIYVEHRKNVNAMIKQAKMDYYESEFATGKQDACFCVIKELTQVPRRMLPEASRTKKLCDDFSMFFSEKIQLIREKITIQLAAMDAIITDKVVNNSIIHKLDQFTPTTEKELERIIRDCPAKTCSLDHRPTDVLEKTLQCQLSYIVTLVNSSFDHGIFPLKLRTAVVKPLLKKDNLDLNVLRTTGLFLTYLLSVKCWKRLLWNVWLTI